MRILLTGGGSGGHVYPLIAIKQTLKQAEFLYIGPDSFARGAFSKEDIKCKFILAGKLRRYFNLLNFIDLFKIPIGFTQSLWHVFWFMPDMVFSKGGYGSIPVVMASWIYRIPIIIHDSDSIPGLANKFLARFAKKIIVSFPEAQKYFKNKKTILLGIPIRKELLQGNKEEAKKIFNLKSNKPVVLIMGGSQGAQKINEIVFNTKPRLLKKCEIIHKPFLEIEQLKHAYAISDVIVSRAGATSIFEIAAVGKPSILIPLSGAASDHQMQNAQALAKIGGAIILNEKNLTMNMFLNAIFGLLDNPKKAKQIGEKAKTFYKPEINQKIAEEISKYAKQD